MWTTCVYVNFLQQVFLILLFWNLGKAVEPAKAEIMDLVEVEDLNNNVAAVLDGRTETLCGDDEIIQQRTESIDYDVVQSPQFKLKTETTLESRIFKQFLKRSI